MDICPPNNNQPAPRVVIPKLVLLKISSQPRALPLHLPSLFGSRVELRLEGPDRLAVLRSARFEPLRRLPGLPSRLLQLLLQTLPHLNQVSDRVAFHRRLPLEALVALVVATRLGLEPLDRLPRRVD
ncbi:hypothetical protein PG999_007800 [Apiospora kogelbergensis]|uniref:Uncharacterized protein n=1 Tax=Apiospora kogelbergensis TaxID=1337665 RepID=A0AAW0QNR7_9PEZI